MKKNVNKLDAFLRVLLAASSVMLYSSGIVPSTSGIILMVIGAVFLITGYLKFCPIYYVFHLSSIKNATGLAND